MHEIINITLFQTENESNRLKSNATSKISVSIYSVKRNIHIIYGNASIISNHIIPVSFLIQMPRNTTYSSHCPI